MKNEENNFGFTLIELLVVISIIALLASVVLLSINSTRQKARDTKRLSDINQVAKVLEMYYGDNGNRYPAGTNVLLHTLIGVSPKYVGALPIAPVPIDNATGQCSVNSACGTPNNSYCYTTDTNRSTYTITFCLGGETGNFHSGLRYLTPAGVK